MTIIAWDGKTLAADKQAVLSDMPMLTTKIFRVRDHLLGFSGEACFGLAMVDWYREGADPDKYPSHQKDVSDYVGLLVIKGRHAFKYERSPFPFEICEPFIAIGSGRDFAMAAMHCGKTAAEAVQIASLFDVNCGMGYDALNLVAAQLGEQND